MNDIATQASVPRDHPSLPGHFPGHPIVPGVVLLDLVLEAIRQGVAAPVALQSIVSAKFLQAVAPEAPIDMFIKFAPDALPGRFKARFTASHASVQVLEGSFLLDVAGPVA